MQPVNERRSSYSGPKRPYFKSNVNHELLQYIYSAWVGVRRDLDGHNTERNVQYFTARVKDERLAGFVPVDLPDYWGKRMSVRNYENRRS